MPDMGGPYRAASGRLSLDARTDRRHPPHRAVRDQRLLLSRAPSGFAQSIGHDIELLKAQDGRRRHAARWASSASTMTRSARFRDDAAAARASPFPSCPGSCRPPISRASTRMAAQCGASIPAWLARAYDGLDDDVESRRIVAAAVLAEQVQQLRAPRLRPVSFLHAQPGQPDLCGLPHAGPASRRNCHEFRPRRPHRLDEGGSARSACCCSTAPGA